MLRSIIIALTLLFFHAAGAQEKDAEAVRRTFENYKTAILNDQGETALDYIDSRTGKYYADMLHAVKNSDSARVSALSLIDRITVFSIRHRASREEILAMTGNDLFVYAIKNGMVGKSGVARNSIGEVTVNGNIAKGRVVVGGTQTPLAFDFHREEGRWKIDLTSIFSFSNQAFRRMVEESGEEENEYLFRLLEMLTGRKPGREVWQKVNQVE